MLSLLKLCEIMHVSLAIIKYIHISNTHKYLWFYLVIKIHIFVMLGIKPKALHMLGKSFMIELYPCTI